MRRLPSDDDAASPARWHSELDHVSIIVRTAEKADAGRQTIAGKASGYHDGRNKHQKRVQARRSLVIDTGRVQAIANQRGLMLDRLVNDCVESVIRHRFEEKRRVNSSRA